MLFIYALLILIPAAAFGQTDSGSQDTLLPGLTVDTLSNETIDTSTSPGADISRTDSNATEIKQPATDSVLIRKKDTTAEKLNLPSVPENRTPSGLMIGIGVGWSLGDFSVIKLWKSSLPDSLPSFGLETYSFKADPDTSLPDSLQQADTAKLKYRIKEQPNVYNMTFPLKLSLLKVRENDRFSASVAFALVSKKFKSLVFADDDSLNRRIDIKQNFLLYYLSIEALYGHKIPERYFSINGVERSDFVAGIGISPLVSLKKTSSTENYSDDQRMSAVNDNIVNSLEQLTSYGLSLSLRAGITTIHTLQSNGAIEVGVFYTLNWYNYFYSNHKRIFSGDIDPDTQNNRKLSFLSSRFEISISILRNVK